MSVNIYGSNICMHFVSVNMLPIGFHPKLSIYIHS